MAKKARKSSSAKSNVRSNRSVARPAEAKKKSAKAPPAPVTPAKRTSVKPTAKRSGSSAKAAPVKTVEKKATRSGRKTGAGRDGAVKTKKVGGLRIAGPGEMVNDRLSGKRGTDRRVRSREIDDAGSATTQDPVQFAEERRTPIKTPLSAKELREFKELLLQKRAQLAVDFNNLADEVTNRKGQGGSEHSAMPIHMADLGSDNWDQEFNLGLLANEHELLREIDEALVRIEKKIYGVCLGTHQPIGMALLRAKPWAKYCIEYARAREEGRTL